MRPIDPTDRARQQGSRPGRSTATVLKSLPKVRLYNQLLQERACFMVRRLVGACGLAWCVLGHSSPATACPTTVAAPKAIERVAVAGPSTGSQANADPSMPADFRLEGSLDVAQPSGSQIALGGWIFDCRSGLQPITERVGSVSVAFYPDSGFGGASFGPLVPVHYQVLGGFQRDDVLAGKGAACPSMGNRVGYWIFVSDTLPAGRYTVHVAWVTWDGAQRQVSHLATKTIVIP
jgi:hypothetical protein